MSCRRGLLKSALLALFLCLALPSPSWGRSQAQSLVHLLQEFRRAEDITPDRFYENADTLRAAIQGQSDPSAKAVYQATLAHLLVLNASHATAQRRDTESPQDSIREWTYQEYIHHAAMLYKQSLANMELLRQTPARQWVPLVKRKRGKQACDESMLLVVWHALREDIDRQQREREGLPTADTIAAIYNRHGLREAALEVLLDGIWDNGIRNAHRRLMALRDEYRDTEGCAQVYLHLASDAMEGAGMKVNERLAMLDQADSIWPKGPWRNNIENRRRELTSPLMSIEYPSVAYPLDTVRVPIATRTLRDFTLSTYQLPPDFPYLDEESHHMRSDEELLKMAKKTGKRVRHTTMQPRGGHNGGMVCRDTLIWHTPDCGLYAMVVEVRGDAPLKQRPRPQVRLVRVSRIGIYNHSMRNGRVRLTAVDSKTGQPMPGVNVEISARSRDGHTFTPLARLVTDQEGRALLDSTDRRDLYIKVSRARDEAQERRRLMSGTLYEGAGGQAENHVAISTDRSIYRPGQPILFSAVAYRQKGWDTQVLRDEEFEVILRDSKWNIIRTLRCRTDSMGVLADTITLPATGLPGTYTLQAGNSRRSVRVEEYVRPTFRVELSLPQENTATSQDSATLEGRVTTYSGIPVSHARVTGHTAWTFPWWWRDGWQEEREQLDTLWTDSEGKFACRIARKGTEEQLRRGRTLEVSVDALSPQGETQQGSLRIPVCNTPLRMRADIPRQICKDYPKPWLINLYSSTDQAVKGSVTCTLSSGGKDKRTFTMQAGNASVPQELLEMKSGCYELVAQANVDGDTASWRQRVELTSLTDTILYHKAMLSVNCVKSTFAPYDPAQVQIGTTLQHAWVRVLMMSNDTTAMDTLMHLSNRLLTWAIPYRQEYGQGLTLNAYLFHEGCLFSNEETLKLKLPDTRLRLHWDSFRDHLRPGQQEEWLLSVRQPDGKPAQANLTASLYDASLDALAMNRLSINVSRWNNVPHITAFQNTPRPDERNRINANFTLRMKKESGRTSYSFDIDRFYLGAPTPMESAPTAAGWGYVRGAKTASPMLSGTRAYKGMSLKEREAGLDNGDLAQNLHASEEVAEDGAEEQEGLANLRTNLQETAFFMPRLRTDAHGLVKINFTLPESMTSWHLLGVAHTADMMVGQLDTIIVAEKELTAELLLPRFLRSGDKATLTATIRNRSEKQQQGKGTLLVSDTETGKALARKTVRFDLAAHADTTLTFPYTGSVGHPTLTVKWVAQGQDYSDGEQRYLPVLPDMQSITETQAFSLNSVGKQSIPLDKLFAHDSKEATGRSLTIEYTRDPKWLAIQTLPSMVSPRCKDALSLAAAFYASSLASNIEQKFPQVAQAIREWNTRDTAALQSPLYKNQELAGVLLQETPWVLESENERERRMRLGTLFDDVAQEDYRMTILNALKNLQDSNGAFAWYPGMKVRTHVTQDIVCQMARLYALTSNEIPMQREMRERGCKFLSQEMVRDVKEMRKNGNTTIGGATMRTLYALALSGYNSQMTDEERQSTKHMLSLLKKQASGMDREERALAAVVLHLYGEDALAKNLMERLHTLINQPDGKHLAYRSDGRTSVSRKTSEHVQLMEAIRMIEPEDTATLDGMREWLIGMKRTQEWENASQTADAVYALMVGCPHYAKEEDRLTLLTASKPRVIRTPTTTLGYVRERMDISALPRTLVIDKKSQGLSYGAVYAQYQTPATCVEAQQEGLSIRRDITGVEHLKTGDRVHVRYTLTAQSDYEFVRLLAPRPAAAEPSAQHSGYEHTGNIGYYKSVHDASTEFFMDQLPKGTHVIEEDWLISRAGTYILPSATLQSLYAPDFQAHTGGTSVEVGQN